MVNSRVFIIVLVLFVAGFIYVLSNPTTPTTPPPIAPITPVPTRKRPSGFFIDLPLLIALRIWPTAIPTPTEIPQPTPTTVPPTETPSPNTPTPTEPTGDTPTPPPAGGCSAMDSGLPNSKERYPGGSTALPATTKEICAFSGTQYYSLPYRNKNCQATQSGIDKAYERMKTYYPSYWQASKLKDDWQTVQQYSIKYGFNPLYVIALWIEESAAGGATSAQKLGCLYRLNKDDSYTFLPPSSTICEQMECLFGLRSVNPANYALWACQYRWGASKWVNNHCLEVTNFTKGVEYWYNYMAENLPGNCQIKFYSNPDPRC
ncbi:hypothetical protein A3C98_05155 [Candidatus Roizmanbacteria bacterium RIFCSPHIGHO2_02_FULL_37_15]|uniref:Uncharacterized protein n=1 Tax=Candidatus Roizmanbacteria bacterium RIFCSPLOWO2_01_FULL_37_16 TaxID=1802058 RepID=A0A1F7IPU8_9BACT|nr:MAG: hypothetical protein A3C98_05155 [Candidatus Roizmanbacteria bacterium RIFCSPHIGHO2_02_FULL_37_15]OGK32073.1 MAG: hypothetical protein A3F57_04780 [Candidatus Roizmanbacteria bacterium RIFCSPHIGHO2_12_FULL_36_11]OGK45398.1 MAG: hypothetical protein A3B40_02750 [Candidatus Roizmanbacteria bacterium RIFCSPLOWO2_01_FULL_37_16]OGK57770.1 MAG: hypothetical protein A3I50_04090 [Candidatus Roizmanbacteria bacterium RIFCSPLOWO2_02_FULL_37_9]